MQLQKGYSHINVYCFTDFLPISLCRWVNQTIHSFLKKKKKDKKQVHNKIRFVTITF